MQELLGIFWNGNLLRSISAMTGREYSAAQNLPAICKRESSCWSSLYLTGWQDDVVKRSGDPFD